MELKELFDKAENGTLTYEQFEAAAKEAKAKFVDLSEGKYVSTNKYNDDLAAKDKEIETLNGTITTRDTDLAGLKQQLADAGADATKLQELTDTLSGLQTKYDNDTKAYKDQLKKQAYEFAVKEFAGHLIGPVMLHTTIISKLAVFAGIVRDEPSYFHIRPLESITLKLESTVN